MIKKTISKIQKLIKQIKHRDFYKEVKKRKKRLFVQKVKTNNFKCKRTKFSALNIKLKFRLFEKVSHNKYVKYYFILGLFLILSISYVVFESPYFSIKVIYIEREDELSDINIAYRYVSDFYLKSIIFTNKSKISDKIKSSQKNIESIKITKNLPNRLKISIKSFTPVFNTKIGDKVYTILKNGSFVPTNGYKSELPLINIHFSDIDNIGILDYKNIIQETNIKKITNILNNVKSNLILAKIVSLDYFEAEKEVHITIGSGVKILFDINIDTTEQLKKLIIFNQKKSKISEKGLIYIDLRPKKKIFYCPDTEEKKCKKNLKRIYGY